MKNPLLLLLPLWLSVAASATAADNTIISIKATIVASPCTVSTQTMSIDLGDIQASTLDAAGKTSPWSPVQFIQLTNCPASTSSVQATFSGSPATNGDTNGYINTAGNTNISIQLADDSETINYLSNGKITADLPVSAGTVNVPVRARLYTSTATQPGNVYTSINVTFTYK